MADEESRWMSFRELARARGTSQRAAVMLVRRHGWPRQQSNAGHTLALVPATFQVKEVAPPTRTPELQVAGHVAPNSADHAVQVLEQALQALREAHSMERAALQAQIAELRAALDQAQAAMKQIQAALEEAEQNAQETQDLLRQAEAADEQRRGQGRWARLRAAWRGGE